MLKLAMSLAVVLALTSPSLAKPVKALPPVTVTPECLTPEGLTGVAPLPLRFRIEGDTLTHFRDAYDMASGKKSSDSADLILVFGQDQKFKQPWEMVAFKNGCEIGARLVHPEVILKLLSGGDTI